MSKILLVEDDRELSAVVCNYLDSRNYSLEPAYDGLTAREFLGTYEYDLIILDWSLPEEDGLSLLKWLRSQDEERRSSTPVIMLTGKNEVHEKEMGLDSGADDYITKPFSLAELAARIRAVMRRPHSFLGTVLKAHGLELDPERRELIRDGVLQKLAPREFMLLEFFLRNPGRVFTPEQLLNSVWSADDHVGPEVVRTSINRIRKQLDRKGDDSIITNVYGVGYKLKD